MEPKKGKQAKKNAGSNEQAEAEDAGPEPIDYKPKAKTLAVSDLKANSYNANEMSETDFKRYAAEVKRMGCIPKPVVVRAKGKKYEIIDGEHAWKAAKEAGLEKIPCEIAAVDEYEAMRQSYKRNQHGKFNRVKLGRLFKGMMEKKELGRRELAGEMDISEGTVRNHLLYVEAIDDWRLKEDQVSGLGVRDLRALKELSTRKERVAWLKARTEGLDTDKPYRGVSKKGRRRYRELLKAKKPDDLVKLILDNMVDGKLEKLLGGDE